MTTKPASSAERAVLRAARRWAAATAAHEAAWTARNFDIAAHGRANTALKKAAAELRSAVAVLEAEGS